MFVKRAALPFVCVSILLFSCKSMLDEDFPKNPYHLSKMNSSNLQYHSLEYQSSDGMAGVFLLMYIGEIHETAERPGLAAETVQAVASLTRAKLNDTFGYPFEFSALLGIEHTLFSCVFPDTSDAGENALNSALKIMTSIIYSRLFEEITALPAAEKLVFQRSESFPVPLYDPAVFRHLTYQSHYALISGKPETAEYTRPLQEIREFYTTWMIPELSTLLVISSLPVRTINKITKKNVLYVKTGGNTARKWQYRIPMHAVSLQGEIQSEGQNILIYKKEQESILTPRFDMLTSHTISMLLHDIFRLRINLLAQQERNEENTPVFTGMYRFPFTLTSYINVIAAAHQTGTSREDSMEAVSKLIKQGVSNAELQEARISVKEFLQQNHPLPLREYAEQTVQRIMYNLPILKPEDYIKLHDEIINIVEKQDIEIWMQQFLAPENRVVMYGYTP